MSHYIIQRAPKCTLFPYTTLFRSKTGWAGDGAGRRRNMEGPDGQRERDGVEPHRPDSKHRRCDDRRSKDRKSTRLNSSHTVISYAVFCLKKKKHIPYMLLENHDYS